MTQNHEFRIATKDEAKEVLKELVPKPAIGSNPEGAAIRPAEPGQATEIEARLALHGLKAASIDITGNIKSQDS